MESREIPGVIGKFGLAIQNEARAKLTEFCQENTLVIENTLLQQHKRQLYTWTSPDGQHRNQIDYILCSQRWRSSIQSTRPGADCGSDHGFLIAKFRLKLKKVGNQEIPGVIGKFGLGVQNEAEQILIEFCQENALVIVNTLFQQHKRKLYTWTSADGQY